VFTSCSKYNRILIPDLDPSCPVPTTEGNNDVENTFELSSGDNILRYGDAEVREAHLAEGETEVYIQLC
jgi:hypothetical protein